MLTSKFRKPYYILFLIILISSLSYADGFFSHDDTHHNMPVFEFLNRDSGLSNLSVSSILQDRDGFLWFGTQGGLNFYNGKDVKVYRNDPFEEDGLLHNLIQTMYYDKANHELWLGTYQGISRLDITTKKFTNYTVEDSNLSDPVVVAITTDKKGNFWAGTLDGLNKINPNTNEITSYEVPGGVVRALLIDSKNRLLIGTYKGLYFFNPQKDDLEKIDIPLPSDFVMQIKEYKKGILTLGLWNGGLLKYNTNTNNIKKFSFKDNRVYKIAQTIDGTEWIGTWGGGLFAISDDKTYHFTENSDNEKTKLPHPIVYSIYQDNSDILWVGTNGGGICKINPRKRDFVKISHNPKNKNSLDSGKINSLFEDKNGNIWIAVYNSGLNVYNTKTKNITKYKHEPENKFSIQDNQITDIFQTQDNKILFATGKGVSSYDYKTKQFHSLDILPEKQIVYAIEEDDKYLWIGTYTNGLYRYNKNSEKITQYNSHSIDNKLSNNLIYDLLYDSKNRLWVATNNGLNLLKPGEDNFEVFHKFNDNRQVLGNNVIRCLFEDSSGRIWIGMNGGGVAQYIEDSNNFKSYLETDGLSSNTVMGILEDAKKRIWLATFNGVSILDTEDNQIYNLTPSDGIGGWEFNTGHLKDRSGNLIFSGIHGITFIPKDFIDVNLIKPKVYITDVTLFQNSINPNKTFFNNDNLTLSPQDNFIGFQFVALDYINQKKIKFSYKLDGFDNNWIKAGKRDYVSFSNLAPGNYELLVYAKTVKGMQSETEHLKFTIEKPWYNTNLAYIGYFLLFILSIFIMFKLRDWYILSKKHSELSIVNSKLKKANIELEESSIKDPLTKLYNRRFFGSKFEELLSLAKRSNSYISLLIVDLDNFKPINDNLGHLVGDRYLTDVGKNITNTLSRKTDFVARYGGDEFVVVLYDTALKGTQTVAENLKNIISNTPLKSQRSEVYKIKATASIGLISLIPEKDITPEKLIELADVALYKAKEKGRNCICSSNKCP